MSRSCEYPAIGRRTMNSHDGLCWRLAHKNRIIAPRAVPERCRDAEPEYYWWDAVFLFRRFFLCLCAVVFQTDASAQAVRVGLQNIPRGPGQSTGPVSCTSTPRMASALGAGPIDASDWTHLRCPSACCFWVLSGDLHRRHHHRRRVAVRRAVLPAGPSGSLASPGLPRPATFGRSCPLCCTARAFF